MLPAYQIIEKLLPFTEEECGCGVKKAKKLNKRHEVIGIIHDYRHGKPVDFSKIQGIDANKLQELLLK